MVRSVEKRTEERVDGRTVERRNGRDGPAEDPRKNGTEKNDARGLGNPSSDRKIGKGRRACCHALRR